MSLPTPPLSLLQDASLFLDFDGTLVRIAERPDAIQVEAALLGLLDDLRKSLGDRLTLVSGRASADVLAWLSPYQGTVVGSHGLERDGEVVHRSQALDKGIRHLRALEARYEGLLLEEKPMGVALHYREAPEAQEDCRAAAEQAAAMAELEVQPGKMVFELKPALGNKGTAIRELMREPPHIGARPIFLGDDLTDEHGFVVARELGGAGVLVGQERETAASYRLEDVDAVHAWLRKACEALS